MKYFLRTRNVQRGKIVFLKWLKHYVLGRHPNSRTCIWRKKLNDFARCGKINSGELEFVLKKFNVEISRSFKNVIPDWKMKTLKKLGEGTYGSALEFENADCSKRVMKIVKLSNETTSLYECIPEIASSR
ncbi:hypothetical protein AVEN_259474-1 [Araneus ventricosus]|uniref:Protein kinase domain-containing protein n=1 Tax=Araneus ventricosus TaxID=182803 RepID=A0A4Y2I254_ARAVE|nr:hypothetical protein AVEN_259474-1 [Araneus ventricosus]